jgi:adenylate cyclase
VVSRDETGLLTEAFNEMAQGLRERERARVAIEKYMSPKVYELIQRGELRIGGESREITVLMTDIRSFTTLAEATPAEQLLTLLNRYFEAMFGPITKYEGEVDKYIGDGILAKFGATVWYPDHARRGVLAAIEMLEACDRLNVELQREGLPELRMGIGANTGAAIVGNIGANERMEYTIISDAVNTAERVGSICKDLNWDLLISHETYAQVRDVVEVGEPTSVRLRGQTRDTLVYPVLGERGAVSLERVRRYRQIDARGRVGVEEPRPLAHPRSVALS